MNRFVASIGVLAVSLGCATMSGGRLPASPTQTPKTDNRADVGATDDEKREAPESTVPLDFLATDSFRRFVRGLHEVPGFAPPPASETARSARFVFRIGDGDTAAEPRADGVFSRPPPPTTANERRRREAPPFWLVVVDPIQHNPVWWVPLSDPRVVRVEGAAEGSGFTTRYERRSEGIVSALVPFRPEAYVVWLDGGNPDASPLAVFRLGSETGSAVEIVYAREP